MPTSASSSALDCSWLARSACSASSLDSASRSALALLEERGVDFEVIDYLEDPPSRLDYDRILALIPDAPAALVRKDDNWKALGLDPDDYQTPGRVAELLEAHPELMQRPVVLKGDRAVIARPPEKLLELLD